MKHLRDLNIVKGHRVLYMHTNMRNSAEDGSELKVHYLGLALCDFVTKEKREEPEFIRMFF